MNSDSFTELIHRGYQGDRGAMNLAYSLVFGQLHATARRLLYRESASTTLQPTVLISELFLRFSRLQCRIVSREHFLSLSARSMKQFLIDRGRGRAVRQRRDPELHSSTPSVCLQPNACTLATRQALARLDRLDPLAAQTIRLLRFAGLTLAEVASLQKRPLWKVHEDSDFATDWLAKQLR